MNFLNLLSDVWSAHALLPARVPQPGVAQGPFPRLPHAARFNIWPGTNPYPATRLLAAPARQTSGNWLAMGHF